MSAANAAGDREASGRPAGPVGAQVPCATCGAPLDTLRAGHVAVIGERFRYFCDRARCRAEFDPSAEPTRGAEVPLGQAPLASAADLLPPLMETGRDETWIEPLVAPAESIVPAPGAERREVGLLLVALTLIAGALAMALELAPGVGAPGAQPSRLVLVARLALLAVGAAALLGRAATTRPDPAAPRRFVMAAGPVLASAVALWALLSGTGEQAARAGFLAGTITTVYALISWLVGWAAQPIEAARRSLFDRLDGPGRRVREAGAPTSLSQKELSHDIRAGEHVLVEAGEVVPVDLTIVEGEVEVVLTPWGAVHDDGSPAGRVSARKRAGDRVVAGAQLLHGQLRGVCTAAGADRALARPFLDPARRPDVHAPIARRARALAERWSIAVAVIAGSLVVVLGWGAIDVAMVVAAVYASLGNVAIGSVPGLAIAQGIRAALARGIVYNGAEAWEVSARASAAVFCARGTLLRGEPEVVEIELFADRVAAGDVLRLAAGALAAERQPLAIALVRACRSKGYEPDAVRSVRSYAGRGVTAIASTSEPLCVGGRSLLLERQVSMAVAERAIYELESAGRTVVLVAKGGRIVGLVALQDGLRPGARAAVQHLLDTRIEPILMSADARETCEALARSLDIDHLRAEVQDDERAAAVTRIRETGAAVAVIGHTPFDDEALRAADASVALGAAGRPDDDFAISLVGDDVREAALALALAQRTRTQAALALGLAATPAAFAALIVTAGLLPAAEFVPLALLVGALVAVWQLRQFDRSLG